MVQQIDYDKEFYDKELIKSNSDHMKFVKEIEYYYNTYNQKLIELIGNQIVNVEIFLCPHLLPNYFIYISHHLFT